MTWSLNAPLSPHTVSGEISCWLNAKQLLTNKDELATSSIGFKKHKITLFVSVEEDCIKLKHH